ncbi:hypothetical protein PSTT_10348 [Puccinia striiformis]|uniref:Uncharacterized protein n=1 Tax=Puccinia striiformis TaxID=27350 RepID=A0A2S4V4R3_9BASI|nr:hypothetical protein PSTT_10348 [Puccinia striiformis]
MIHNARGGDMKTIRSLNHDILTSGLPAGVDPDWMPPLSTGTMVFLAVLLVFHVLVAAACSIILLLPYIGKRSESHGSLRYTPLLGQYWDYDVHLGISGLHQHPNVSLPANRDTCITALASRTQYGPAIMLICNIYSYWSTAHGFLTLSYTNKIFVDDSKNLRWLRSPLLINVSFITFPITVAATIAILQTNLCLNFHELQVQLRILQATLSEGSLAWNQFQRTHSSDDQERISFQMLKRGPRQIHRRNYRAPLRDKFLLLRSAMLVFMLATTLVSLLSFDPVGIAWVIPKIGVQSVFVFSFWKLTRTFHKKRGRSNNSTYLKSDCSGLPREIVVFKGAHDVWLNPDWHGFMTWLPALSGSWAAVPLTLQSWRLYQDQKRPPVSSSEHKEDVIPVHIGQAPEGFTYNHDRLSEIKNLDQTSIS